MILLDANILVSAVIGVQVKRILAETATRGVTLGVTEPQLVEAARVLTQKLGLTHEEAELALEAISALVAPVGPESYAAAEPAARQRLHRRAQADWPVLAAALAFDGGIWSHDRDFFGAGVPVWSSRNMRYAPSAG